MSEKEIIDSTENGPITYSSLVNDFKALGIKSGMTLWKGIIKVQY